MIYLSSYPKIRPVGHKLLDGLFDGTVLPIQEKIDGSQFSFGRLDDQLIMRSKNVRIENHDVPKIFRFAVKYILELYNNGKLTEGYVYRGEVLETPKHNTLVYGRIPRHNIILFDIMRAPESYIDYKSLCYNAQQLDLEAVPLLGTTKHPLTREQLNKYFQFESILGGTKIEGIVIKNHHMRHHYQDPELGFGVSSPLWDIILKTDYDVQKTD